MTYIRNASYNQERLRPNLLTNYLHSMCRYLQLQHPDVPHETIEGFVKEKVKERFKTPEVSALIHRREGETQEINQRLDHYVRDTVADNNLAPSGTCYYPVSRKESFLRISIDGKVKERNAFKKLYLSFEAQGQKRESQYYYQNQANAKIFNNAIAGGMGTKQFILGDKAGFNSITSVGRVCVKQGYSYVERAVNGNIYLPTIRDAITYVINHIRHIPVDFYPLIAQGVLHIPSSHDVFEYLLSSVSNYTNFTQGEHSAPLWRIIGNLTNVERSYVFYAGCLNNLCRFNEVMMRSWIDSCFIRRELDVSEYCDISIDELKDFPGDVVNLVLATNYQRLGKHSTKKGRWNSLKDAREFNHDGLKQFIFCCRHFVKHFEPHLRVIKPILQIETTFSRMTMQNKMARYTVPLSDTDSNIFSTQELVRWKTGKIDFSQESYEMNAITVFMLSQTLEHVFARLSAGFGVEGEDVFRIAMKNEFLYPVAIVTSLAKHYMAIATMQEGSLLPSPRKDIKGVGLRSSTYPKLVRDSFEKYVVDLFAEIQKGESIFAGGILKHIAELEQTIYTSVTNLESDYLQTVTVRRKEDYTDPEKSQYFYYDLWRAVFSDEMGEMVLPNKCYKVPLKGGKKLFKDPEFMARLKSTHPTIHDNLVRFMDQNPNRVISAVLVPPSKGPINPLFLEMMDIRSHISQIMMGYYHLLNALGIGSVDTNQCGLVSDFFDPSTALME